jgi:uncharacterized protein
MKNKTLDKVTVILLLLGGVCWGLVGAFDFEPISAVLSEGGMFLARTVYVLIGLSALYRIFCWAKKAR